MLAALENENITPKQITGSSAGALVGTFWAAGINAHDLIDIFCRFEKKDFWDPGLGFGWLKGIKFRQQLKKTLPVQTFEDCRCPLHLSVFNGYSRKTEVITSGQLVPALYASCAVPFLFMPVWINSTPYWDGGIKDRPGMAGLEQNERVFYHHIPSRSPWRRKNSPALNIPEKNNMLALQIKALPRSGPNKLHLGKTIFSKTYDATKKALKESVNSRAITIFDHI